LFNVMGVGRQQTFLQITIKRSSPLPGAVFIAFFPPPPFKISSLIYIFYTTIDKN